MLVRNYHFQDQDVVLDFGEFYDCTFEGCNLILHGYAPPSLVGCTFNNCRWSFEGPASTTVQFMTALHRQGGGGRELIEHTFENIRRGGTE